MKVLFIAPRICTPWTEGRKKLVRDLISQTAARWQLCGLVTIDAGESTDLPENFAAGVVSEGKAHLVYLVRNLEQALAQHRPDLVCHFPFGAFAGLRGLGNLWAIAKVARICRNQRVPCCTLMYSLTAGADTPLHRLLLRDVYFNQHAGGAKGIRFGVKLPAAGAVYSADSRTLLFMAGEAVATSARLDYVLDTRGLRYLLQAGGALTRLGYRLVVAVPFLKSVQMQDALRRHPDNSWGVDGIEFRAEVTIPAIFQGIRAFVFPYGHEERQFVPTSMVEAMHFGIPVVFPRLKFLAQFHAEAAQGLAYEPGDVQALIAQVRRLDTAPAEIEMLRKRALHFVAAEYSIANTVSDIERIYHQLAAQPDSPPA
jgi:glycosyltransferase involved in cell wall biosynthesis